MMIIMRELTMEMMPISVKTGTKIKSTRVGLSNMVNITSNLRNYTTFFIITEIQKVFLPELSELQVLPM
jgi:uncharacterized Zn ribbon protein